MSKPIDSLYRATQGLLRFLIRLFFRQVDVAGLENLPGEGGGLLIAGHPNGLIDPAVIMAVAPRRIVFGARHGLFEWPLIGRLIKRLGTVPIYRSTDENNLSEEERRKANLSSLDGLAQAVADGSFSALFPEGLSHDLPHLSTIKTGAARLFYRARALQSRDSVDPVIIPVGLYYDRKNIFRSRVLVSFQPAMTLPPELDRRFEEDGPELRHAVHELTSLIETRLSQVIGATEDWHIHHLMERARKLIRAHMAWESGINLGPPTLSEDRLGYARIWQGYQARRATEPDGLADLRIRLSRYDRYLTLLRLNDHELTDVPRMSSVWRIALLVAQVVTVYVLFPPVLVLGVLINIGPYFLLKWLTRKVSTAKKDEATLKIMGGAVLFPLVWILVAVGVWFAEHQVRSFFPDLPNLSGLVVLVTLAIAIGGGYLALIYTELSAETLRAIRVRMLHRREKDFLDELVQDRGELCRELKALGAGLTLPGHRMPDGRLVEVGAP